MTKTIELADGKYTIVYDDNNQFPTKCLRHGEEWRDLTGDNLIFWLCARIEELEELSSHLMNMNNNIETVNCVYRPVEELHSAKCPHCGESYYTENYSVCTALYCPPIYKNGVNINPDTNKAATCCTCMNCGKEFSY